MLRAPARSERLRTGDGQGYHPAGPSAAGSEAELDADLHQIGRRLEVAAGQRLSQVVGQGETVAVDAVELEPQHQVRPQPAADRVGKDGLTAARRKQAGIAG